MTISQTKTQWDYLEQSPHSWRKQLYLKGRRQRAFTVWMDMIVNEMTPEEVAESKDLPLAAVYEAIEYCETHQELLKQEAQEELHRLEHKGVSFESQITD